MNKDANYEDMEGALLELRGDIVFPVVPDFRGRVRGRIDQRSQSDRRNMLLLGLSAVTLAVAFLVIALAVSPDARATLMPWWTAGPSCPGRITGTPLRLKTVTASDLCRDGYVLTQPARPAHITRLQAIGIVDRKILSLSSGAQESQLHAHILDLDLATVHEQLSKPPLAREAWVAIVEIAAQPQAYYGFFVDATSGSLLPRTNSHYADPTVFPGSYVAPAEPAVQYGAIDFPNPRDGFVLATTKDAQYLLYTRNDGRSWESRLMFLSPEWLQFLDAEDGWLVGTSLTSNKIGLFRTVNGGKSWQRQLTLGQSWPVVQFTTNRVGWLRLSYDGRVIHTTDEGQSWHPAHWPFRSSRLTGWSFRNSRDGWASVRIPGPRGTGCALTQLYATFDGGQHWTKRPMSPGCYSLPTFANNRDGWMLTDPNEYELFEGPSNCLHDYGCPSALLQTVDGGRTWTVEHPVAADETNMTPQSLRHLWPGGIGYDLSQPVFTDSSHGWMAVPNAAGGAPLLRGLSGGVTTTNNGGLTWRFHHLGLGSFDLEPVTNTEAWLTLDNGIQYHPKSYVLHTTNEGRTWRVVRVHF